MRGQYFERLCRAAVERIRQIKQSRPDSGPSLQVNVLESFSVVPSSIGSGTGVARSFKNSHLPRTPINPSAWAYCSVLGGCIFLYAKYPCSADACERDAGAFILIERGTGPRPATTISFHSARLAFNQVWTCWVVNWGGGQCGRRVPAKGPLA